MRAVITGTDFIKDTDGVYKAIEINTNVALQCDPNVYLNKDIFETFVIENSFNEINLIYNGANIQLLSELYDLEEKTSREDGSIYETNFVTYLKQFCSGSNINFIESKLEDNSVTIPFVEDNDNKLIIRIAYDTTALIDDTYARDNWEFLKLMNDSDSNSIPKTYINDAELGFDSIGTTLRDNGNHPNYCIKKRITPADNNVYPKFHKITTIEELTTIKSNLEIDEYIQEYIFNDSELFDNKLSHYRSVDMIYGSELESLNLMIVEVSNIGEIIETPDYDDDNVIQMWDTIMYKNKFNSATKSVAVKLSADDDTKILKPNNDIVYPANLNVNDEVKTMNLDASDPSTWSLPLNDLLTNTTSGTTLLKAKDTIPYFGPILEIQFGNNTTFSDVPHAMVLKSTLIDGVDTVKFSEYQALNVGDTVILWDNQDNKSITETITEIKYLFQSLNAYILDFEDFDTFLTISENDNTRYGLLTHNYNYDCYRYSCNGDYMPQLGYACGGGAINACQRLTACVRVGGWYENPSSAACTTYWGHCEDIPSNPQGLGFCNWQKSDIEYKENIELVGKSNNGINIYRFNYKGESGLYEGVMANELVGTKFEKALKINEKGLYSVYYNKLDVQFKKLN